MLDAAKLGRALLDRIGLDERADAGVAPDILGDPDLLGVGHLLDA
jgi:hypothetical protein